MAETGVRLRQAVLVATELEPVVAELREALGLGAPYADPGVAAFGLRNAVCSIGDGFLEVVSPNRPLTPAARHLSRQGGDCGYMVILQLDDLKGGRARAREERIRVVWEIDLPDIATTHLHPADMEGAIVSLDRPDPPESWRWGGPDWIGRAGVGATGRLEHVTIGVPDPSVVAARWGRVLGVDVHQAPGSSLELDGGRIDFVSTAETGRQGLVEIGVGLPMTMLRESDAVDIGGVRFRRRPIS